MNENIKIILNKCLNMNMNEVKETIKRINKLSCIASNKAIEMWKDYDRDKLNKFEKYLIENNEIFNNEVELKYNNDILKIKNNLSDNAKIKFKEGSRKYIYKCYFSKFSKIYDDKAKEKNIVTYQNVIEKEMKRIMDICNSSNVGTLHQQAVQNVWNREKDKALSYKSAVPSFKEDTPCYFKSDNIKLEYENGYFVGLSFFSKKGLQEINQTVGYRVKFQVDKLDGNKKATIQKMIEGNQLSKNIKNIKDKLKNANSPLKKEELKNELNALESGYDTLFKQGKIYKQGSGQIKISNKGKIELIISFGFEGKQLGLNKNRILGVDLGIVNVATLAIWDDKEEGYDYVNYKQNILSGKELICFRQKLHNMGMSKKDIENKIYECNNNLHQTQLNKFNVGAISGLNLLKFRSTTEQYKKELCIASKYVGEGRAGHGYNTKMKPIDKIRNKVSNFSDTYNHKYSKYIVDFAKKNNCGVIQMEDLSGATRYAEEKFLKDWSYYDLQQKITYKAEKEGIMVIKIKPNFTSQRCSVCGNIHKENRDCKNNQARFKCISCGHEENADINAAKNIAIPNIDTIISDYIKLKTKDNKINKAV